MSRKASSVTLVFRGMRPFLQIEIGQHPQQGRAHVDAVVSIELEQTLEAGKSGWRLQHGHCAFAATLSI